MIVFLKLRLIYSFCSKSRLIDCFFEIDRFFVIDSSIVFFPKSIDRSHSRSDRFADCLDVFIATLERAPLTVAHLPALFYLAETSLYWLRTDAVKQPYLRAGEIKLLRVSSLDRNCSFCNCNL